MAGLVKKIAGYGAVARVIFFFTTKDTKTTKKK